MQRRRSGLHFTATGDLHFAPDLRGDAPCRSALTMVVASCTTTGHYALVSDRATGDEIVEDDLLQALAGAVLLRDRLAELGDHEGTTLALLTVEALNRLLDALSVDHPSGLAGMVPREGRPPVPGFV